MYQNYFYGNVVFQQQHCFVQRQSGCIQGSVPERTNDFACRHKIDQLHCIVIEVG